MSLHQRVRRGPSWQNRVGPKLESQMDLSGTDALAQTDILPKIMRGSVFDKHWTTTEVRMDPSISEHYDNIAARLRRGESIALSDVIGISGFISRLRLEFPDARIQMLENDMKK